MVYQYTGLIPENIAPKGAAKVGVYDAAGDLICSIGLGRLTPPGAEPRYSFGLLSDVHIVHRELADIIATRSTLKLDSAMTWFEEQGCVFCCHAGDSTNVGFYMEGDTETLYPDQYAEYRRICGLHPNLPLYGLCGNHDSYVNPVTQTPEELQAYTGHGLYYKVTYEDDVFLFIGQPQATEPMNVEELQWLYVQLEEHRNQRCFVFVHSFLSGDSGNARNVYENKIFDWWSHTPVFKNLMSHYKNTILFHGHSHLVYEHQKDDAAANYTSKNGFRSVHVSSCAYPMEIVDGVRVDSAEHESLGYLVDVYEDCIVLRARDFGKVSGDALVNPAWVPIGTYKIDTALAAIPAGGFSDSTGTVMVS